MIVYNHTKVNSKAKTTISGGFCGDHFVSKIFFSQNAESPTDFFVQNSIQIGRRAKRGGFQFLALF
ncbi:hypothetical protein A3I40_02355 [Candidatus Uhrbacteria bacterium RIFCSPLOWO2_02_FULL_48_12]|uniref:Uncharacterized protein n=1 Tax=Candidatus Uhrbacteria bacterium RIFCSPLOWO2_02_FULL_48_12 TaxID=1802407 RepID=A0A1F7VBI5_9BACT|nr:MAG: hypothetical protein A3I40_02355 [Candidatus Uhrbacteria bacterium RIFCSPLOWO2_02_FULL_48_12]